MDISINNKLYLVTLCDISVFRISNQQRQAINLRQAVLLLLLVSCLAYYLIMKWRRYILPKVRDLSNVHSVTTQKTILFNLILFISVIIAPLVKWVPLSHFHGAYLGCRQRNCPPDMVGSWNTQNKQSLNVHA